MGGPTTTCLHSAAEPWTAHDEIRAAPYHFPPFLATSKFQHGNVEPQKPQLMDPTRECQTHSAGDMGKKEWFGGQVGAGWVSNEVIVRGAVISVVGKPLCVLAGQIKRSDGVCTTHTLPPPSQENQTRDPDCRPKGYKRRPLAPDN